jgi:ribosomal protein S18 acetylase RimI-like enzyme
MRSRTYEHPRDLRTLQDLVSRTWTPGARWHIGEIAWNRLQHVGRESGWRTRIWEDDGTTVAWGWVWLPEHLDVCVDPAFLDLTDEVLDWFESEATDDERTVTITEAEVELGRALARRGYQRADEDRFFLHLHRDLDHLPEPVVPSPYSLRSVRGDHDLALRVAIHRAAFVPSDVTDESYRSLMDAWPYRADLDCVVEAADGTFVSSCLAWLDEHNRAGVLEPVGTHPDHRRRGLGSAVCLEALTRLRDAGATQAVVAARGDGAYPSARGLYTSIGFRTHTRNVTYRASRLGRRHR